VDEKRKISPNSTNIFDGEAVEESEDGATTIQKVLRAKAILEEATKGTTSVHRNHSKALHASWLRRLLNWFRSD